MLQRQDVLQGMLVAEDELPVALVEFQVTHEQTSEGMPHGGVNESPFTRGE
jgi:hypothetical protein